MAIKIAELAKVTGYSELTLRVGLQRGKFPFGTAFKSDERNTKYTYVLYDSKVKEFFDLSEEQMRIIRREKKNDKCN